MIEVGDIVFRVESDIVNFAKIGLILESKTFFKKQHRVSFVGELPAWWEEKYLYKIEGKENDA